MTRINSRQKGKRIELQAAKFLTSIGYPAHRTAQVRGKNDGSADLELPGNEWLHVEVKGDQSIDVGTKALERAYEQAKRDAYENTLPVVLWRRNRGGWRMTFMVREHGTVSTIGQNGIRGFLNYAAAYVKSVEKPSTEVAQ